MYILARLAFLAVLCSPLHAAQMDHLVKVQRGTLAEALANASIDEQQTLPTQQPYWTKRKMCYTVWGVANVIGMLTAGGLSIYTQQVGSGARQLEQSLSGSQNYIQTCQTMHGLFAEKDEWLRKRAEACVNECKYCPTYCNCGDNSKKPLEFLDEQN